MSFKLAQSETVHIMVHFSFELKNVTIKRMPSMMALGNNACRVILTNRVFEAMLNERAEGYDMGPVPDLLTAPDQLSGESNDDIQIGNGLGMLSKGPVQTLNGLVGYPNGLVVVGFHNGPVGSPDIYDFWSFRHSPDLALICSMFLHSTP